MKKTSIGILLLCSAWFLSATTALQNKSRQVLKPATGFSIVDTIKRFCEPFPVNTQFSVAVIEKGKVQFFGVKKETNGIKEIDNKDWLFEIGSMTKVFTSTIAASCINNGLMQLDDPIQKFLPVTLRKIDGIAPAITIKELVNHTSGFQRGPTNMNPQKQDDPYVDYDSTMLYEYLKDSLVLDNTPGSRFSYSNLGAGLMGFIICHQLKKNYESALKEIILDPLKMENTFVTIPKAKQKKLVHGLDQDGKEVSNWNFDVLAGAGAIRSSASDMVKFLQANLNPSGKLGEAIFKTQQETFTIDSIGGLGMGWFTFHKNGKKRLFHNGGTGGYRSCMIIDLVSQRAVVILNNVSGYHPKSRTIDELGKKLVEAE